LPANFNITKVLSMSKENKIRVLVVGAGNMGRSHALAYAAIPEFEIAAICTRKPESRAKLMAELPAGTPEANDYARALEELKPDAVCISTYPDTHYPFAKLALEAGCHVFTEKPLAESAEQCKELVDLARLQGKALVVGYILRQHPSWIKFVEVAKTLGKPLVMRMNLNQQSYGKNWETHKSLLSSISPIVDCGVHYVDVMCQMTGAKPLRVSGLGAQLTDELPADKINYGHLQVTFEDGSVGWYEAGWGPMMSETPFLLRMWWDPKEVPASSLLMHPPAENPPPSMPIPRPNASSFTDPAGMRLANWSRRMSTSNWMTNRTTMSSAGGNSFSF